jgi:hypothetical protein
LSDWQLSTPVALLVFNRPEATERVFERVRWTRPPKLLVVADGPCPEREGESDRCAAAREVTERIDWPCEVLREYSEVNLGCRDRVSSGLDWVFTSVERAIVLEDDCVPHPTFFRFCEELLERYADEERLMHISGDNFQAGRRRGAASYYFSRYPHVWGWASWRRAWQAYDVRIEEWARDPEAHLRRFSDAAERSFWAHAWNGVRNREIDTWDFQWAFACLAAGGLAINPNYNLVSNIGFEGASTHTGRDESGVAALPLEGVSFPLSHPTTLKPDLEAEGHTARLFFTDDTSAEGKGQTSPTRWSPGRGFLRRLLGGASR